jgi:catechol 2,3-dioxygenase-like lactoylglutathione lyase family enzyme
MNEYNHVMHAPSFTRIDHVHLAMPPGEEGRARAFFVGVLGMNESAKPENLAQRGGCWFASGDVQIHLGVEGEFRAARKAHPALRCSDYTRLLQHLRAKGIEVIEAADIPGVQRAHIFDPFGNRIELMAE